MHASMYIELLGIKLLYTSNMNDSTNIAHIANLIGDPSRAKMLVALMSGRALTATELALDAEVTSQTASSHLKKLLACHLITLEKQGRHKYFRLATPQVAELLDSLITVSSTQQQSTIHTGPRDSQMRFARICYDHLAGELSVSLFNSLLDQELISIDQCHPVLTDVGINFFYTKGVDIQQLLKAKRPLCKTCLDWSERRHHLAGSLGKWILMDIIEKGWAKQDLDSRVIRFSETGLKRFKSSYNIAP